MKSDEDRPLRGDLLHSRRTDMMEQMHNAHFQACVAAAGCSSAKPTPDDGIDWLVLHRSSLHKIGRTARVEIQLKSTSCHAPPTGAHFPFRLDGPTFDRLTEPSHLPRLLVVCLLPPNVDEWMVADVHGSAVHLQRLSYWFVPQSDHRTGRTQTTVHIPTDQVFDDLALCDIMRRVGRGEEL
jgi:hypothetical protein